jgi:cell division septal protein FtsQ
MSLVQKRLKLLVLMLVFLLALGIGFPPVWAEEKLPTVATADFYGLRMVTEPQVRAELGIKGGDPAPVGTDTKQEATKRLEKIPHVARAKLPYNLKNQSRRF